MSLMAGAGQTSYLQLYWLLQSGRSALLTLRHLLIPASRDSKQADDPAERALGWTEFRRHPTTCQLISAACSIYVMWTVVSAYAFDTPPGDRFAHLLAYVTDPRPTPSVEATSTLLAVSLYTVHSVRRLYECLRVCIFSRRRTVGLLSLLSQLMFPLAASLSLVAHSVSLHRQPDWLWSVHWYHLAAVVAFIAASKVQSDTIQYLPRTRRNRAGHVVTTGYKLPRGGWFDRLQVSCPHYLAEIVIHAAVGVALGMRSPTWWMLTGHVTLNHIQMAAEKQRFYCAKFDDFPAQRKILIPYIL